MYELIFVHPWPWWASGPAIGLYVLGLLYWQRRPLGASASYTDLVETAQGHNNPDEIDFSGEQERNLAALPLDPRDPAPRWRLWLIAGVALGGLAGWLAGGEATGGAGLPGMHEALGLGLAPTLGLLFAAGIFIGFGTRMSGGCTSGHAITGISALQLPSLLATCVFFATGMAASFLMAWLAGTL
jgi:uncharacterized membrane protein YedE/YeeE